MKFTDFCQREINQWTVGFEFTRSTSRLNGFYFSQKVSHFDYYNDVGGKLKQFKIQSFTSE